MKKVVIDTNVLLVSISQKYRLHWIFKSLIAKKFILCVTMDILSEYAEIIERHMGHEASESVIGATCNLSNVQFITSYFKFRLLKDEDDDKFVDCAIAANASYIVSHDKDFKILGKIDFPKVKVIDSDKFKSDLDPQ